MDLERDPLVPVAPPGQDQLPFEDGVPMETIRHRVQMNVLIDTLLEHWPDREDLFASGNMFVYFSELQTRSNDFRGPDVFVVLGTDRKKVRKSWVAWEEDGKLPDVVIELLSESTRAIDEGIKKRIYERVWKVGTYVLYDPLTHELHAYVRGRQSTFEKLAPADNGDLLVAELGLSLGVRPGAVCEQEGPFLRWIDGGVTVPTAREELDAERARASEERARASEELEAARARIAALEAEIAKRP